jgi:hypothetical protein
VKTLNLLYVFSSSSSSHTPLSQASLFSVFFPTTGTSTIASMLETIKPIFCSEIDTVRTQSFAVILMISQVTNPECGIGILFNSRAQKRALSLRSNGVSDALLAELLRCSSARSQAYIVRYDLHESGASIFLNSVSAAFTDWCNGSIIFLRSGCRLLRVCCCSCPLT